MIHRRSLSLGLAFLPLLAALLLAAAFWHSPAQAQGDEEYRWMVKTATSTNLQDLRRSGSGNRVNCYKSEPSGSVQGQGGAYNVLGFCIDANGSNRKAWLILDDAGDAFQTDDGFATSLLAYGIGNPVVRNIAWSSRPWQSDTNQNLTKSGAAHGSFLTVFGSATDLYSVSIENHSPVFHSYNSTTLTPFLIYNATITRGSVQPVELAANVSADYSRRTITWQWGSIGNVNRGKMPAGVEVQREELAGADLGAIFWGNVNTWLTTAKDAGEISLWAARLVDHEANADKTYRYRVRYSGWNTSNYSTSSTWSSWSDWYISIGQSTAAATPALQAQLSPQPDQPAYALASNGNAQAYAFEVLASDDSWPVNVQVRGDAFRLSATDQGNLSSCGSLATSLDVAEASPTFYVYGCALGESRLYLSLAGDQRLVAEYTIFLDSPNARLTPSETDPTDPDDFRDRSAEDHLGITQSLEQLFEITAVNFNPVLAKNLLVLIIAVGLGSIPLVRAGGRLSVPSLTTGFLLASLVMWGATMVVGYPVWWAVTPGALIVMLGVISVISRVRRAS